MMSGKRRHQEGIARREALEKRDLLAARARGIPVNPDELASYKYDSPDFIVRGFYADRPFECETCGEPQVWTAEQQKWWYEVAKGSVYSYAKLCRPCRQASRRRGDHHPYKNACLLMAKVRSEIEPRLTSRGFRLVGQGPRGAHRNRFVRSLLLQYSREDDLLSISWDHRAASLTANLLVVVGDDLRTVTVAEFEGCRSATEIDSRIRSFVLVTDRYLTDAGR
jgi:Probable zinc-ribbon domain